MWNTMKITRLIPLCTLLGVIAMTVAANPAEPSESPIAIAIHGGSGTIEKGGFYLPFKKHMRIRSQHLANGIPTALIVVCKDKAMRLWMGKHDDLEVIWWGDTRIDETHDREPMVVVPPFFFSHLYDRN